MIHDEDIETVDNFIRSDSPWEVAECWQSIKEEISADSTNESFEEYWKSKLGKSVAIGVYQEAKEAFEAGQKSTTNQTKPSCTNCLYNGKSRRDATTECYHCTSNWQPKTESAT
jgi:hypothetical protein